MRLGASKVVPALLVEALVFRLFQTGIGELL